MIVQRAHCDQCRGAFGEHQNVIFAGGVDARHAMSLTRLKAELKKAGWRLESNSRGRHTFPRILCPDCARRK